MYLTIDETAEYLEVSPEIVDKLIQNGKIRTISDGEQILIYKDQFATHLEQLKKYKLLMEEWLSEPIPEDWDAKDED